MQMAQCSRSSRSKHALDPLAVGQFQQQFFRAVVGLAAGRDPGGPNLKLLGQLLADRLGQIGHFVEGGRAVAWKSHRRSCFAR